MLPCSTRKFLVVTQAEDKIHLDGASRLTFTVVSVKGSLLFGYVSTHLILTICTFKSIAQLIWPSQKKSSYLPMVEGCLEYKQSLQFILSFHTPNQLSSHWNGQRKWLRSLMKSIIKFVFYGSKAVVSKIYPDLSAVDLIGHNSVRAGRRSLTNVAFLKICFKTWGLKTYFQIYLVYKKSNKGFLLKGNLIRI